MHRRLTPRLSFANVTSVLALVLAVSSPAWAGPAANSAASLVKQVKKAVGLSKKANKTAKAASKKADQALAQPGPQGPAGPQGAQGPQGPQGAQGQSGRDGTNGTNAASAFTGRATATVPILATRYLAPSGNSTPDAVVSNVFHHSPNAPVVARDLRVKTHITDWKGLATFTLVDDGVETSVRCTTPEHATNTETSCNSGSATHTIDPGSDISLKVTADDDANAEKIRFGWRAITP